MRAACKHRNLACTGILHAPESCMRAACKLRCLHARRNCAYPLPIGMRNRRGSNTEACTQAAHVLRGQLAVRFASHPLSGVASEGGSHVRSLVQLAAQIHPLGVCLAPPALLLRHDTHRIIGGRFQGACWLMASARARTGVLFVGSQWLLMAPWRLFSIPPAHRARTLP
jgi:hypothetical protein